MLSDPMKVMLRAMRAKSLPAYSYAMNNPITFRDPDGKGPCSTTYDCCIDRAIEAGLDPQQQCNATEEDIKKRNNTLRLLGCEEAYAECKSKANTACPGIDPLSKAKQGVLVFGCKLAYEACKKGFGLPN